MKNIKIFALLAALTLSVAADAQHQYVVNAKKLGAAVQPTMYGIFFEDINFGADGGLYAELIENRSFEYPQQLMGWNFFGNVTVSDVNPAFERNPHYVTLSDPGHHDKFTGVENHGFFGIGLKRGSSSAAFRSAASRAATASSLSMPTIIPLPSRASTSAAASGRNIPPPFARP